MNRLAFLFVLLVAAMLAGCSSHAPSAARFMAVKPNSISYGFGGGGVLGDDNSHHEEENNGKVYNYSELRFCLSGQPFLEMTILYLALGWENILLFV